MVFVVNGTSRRHFILDPNVTWDPHIAPIFCRGSGMG